MLNERIQEPELEHTHVSTLLDGPPPLHPHDHVSAPHGIRVVDWGGELVFSLFLNFSRRGDRLFAEASYFLLPPLASDYHEIDDLAPRLGWREARHFATRALLETPLLWLASPLTLLAKLASPYRRWQRRRSLARLIRRSPTFDYGASTSIRERAQADTYHRYFQKLDKQMHAKLVEGVVLDSVVHFLDQHQIDTNELRERRTTIVNKGLFMTGGSIEAGAVTVGEQATSVFTHFATPAPTSPRPAAKH